MDTFTSIDYNKLTNKDRSETIESLMLLTEKLDVRTKRITCADGIKQ